jgi:2-oxoglutarate ferredoxin oxidoreductase subunit alpha
MWIGIDPFRPEPPFGSSPEKSMETQVRERSPERRVEKLNRVVIRFAGDSGDGMQITGDRFTATAAAVGNDLNTLPDYPAEIRAPAGTLPGVSAFQINFSSEDIQTPGDEPDVLVAMNPAALQVNIRDLKRNGVLIVNTGAFGLKDLEKANYKTIRSRTTRWTPTASSPSISKS